MLLLQSKRAEAADCPAFRKREDGSSLPGMYDKLHRCLSFGQHKTVARPQMMALALRINTIEK